MPEVAHESLELAGYWRIAWFGRLCQNPLSASRDLRIQAYLARLDATNDATLDNSTITPPLKCMSLPVGELPRLHLNAVLHNGRLASHQMLHFEWEKVLTRELDFSTANVQIIGRNAVDETGNHVIPVRPKWASDDTEKFGLFVAIGSATDPYATIIPAIEVFRFFYATSDVVANSLLKDHFLDPHMHLWDINKTALSEDGSGRAVIWLRKWMLDADARFLARFAFDEYALKQAQEIILSAANQDPRYGDRLIRARPPFQDTVKCNFVCRLLDDCEDGRILMTRLVSCDWKPNFMELHWDRDNDGRTDPDKREERDPANWAPSFLPVPDEKAKEIERLRDSAPALNVPIRLRESEISKRFPELDKVPAQKLPVSGSKTRADATNWEPIMYQAYQGSVVEGRSSSQCITRAIIEGLEMLTPVRQEETDEVDAFFGDEDMWDVLRWLRELAEDHHSRREIIFLTVLSHFSYVEGVPVNVFPEEIDGKHGTWLYMDAEMTKRRMAMIARVQEGKLVFYIIELQRKFYGECPTLVVQAEQGGDIPNGVLAALLMDCARQQAAKLRSAKLFSLNWGRVRHSTYRWREYADEFLRRASFCEWVKEKPPRKRRS